MIRFISLSLLLVLSILSMIYSIEAKGGGREFSFSNSVEFDFSISLSRLKSGLENFAHLKGFFVMSLLALFGFKDKKFIYTFMFVGLLTVITEGLQSLAPTRHARLTDGLPNLMGMLLAIFVYSMLSYLINIFKKRSIES
jgi:VanZ family protein